jgi:hypothetical protein
MRPTDDFSTLLATSLAALFMVALILIAPGLAFAGDAVPRAVAAEPRLDLRHLLDESDEIATLDALHTALNEVGDGNTYVWHRRNGRISAIMQPKLSFKDDIGQVCRHLVIMLVSGHLARKSEVVACRMSGGRWEMTG